MKSVIFVVAGIIGFVATVAWIAYDLLTKEQRDSRVIKAAMGISQNREPIRKTGPGKRPGKRKKLIR
jgi:hypothetical protein